MIEHIPAYFQKQHDSQYHRSDRLAQAAGRQLPKLVADHLDLLREKKILLINGRGFNWDQPDHFRVVYLPRVEVLEDAMGKLRDFLSYYYQK